MLFHLYRQISLLPSTLVTNHDNSQGVKVTYQSPAAIESDDDTSMSSSPPGGRGGYVPSMLEQHTSKVVDLHKLGMFVLIWCYYI